MNRRPTLHRPALDREPGWRQPVLALTVLLTALTTAVAIVFMSATQLTERNMAQRFLARALHSLLEIDQFVLHAWPELEAAAADGSPILLEDFPVALQLDRAGLAEGPIAVAEAIAAATASLVYDAGLDVLSESPRAFRLLSRDALFDGSVGRLTGGGHELARIGLIVSGTLAVLLVLATAAQVRGFSRIGAPALAIGLGAALVWIVAAVARSAFEGQAETSADPLAADLGLIAADAVSLLVRNGAIVTVTAGVVGVLSLAAGGLLRALERANVAQSARNR